MRMGFPIGQHQVNYHYSMHPRRLQYCPISSNEAQPELPLAEMKMNCHPLVMLREVVHVPVPSGGVLVVGSNKDELNNVLVLDMTRECGGVATPFFFSFQCC